jgi:hypothetical protein
MLFPKAGVAEECSTMPAPIFLSGEKKQAVCTSMSILPQKKVEKVNKEVNSFVLESYLYVTYSLCIVSLLTPPRSKYPVELSQDLDDAAVSLLIQNGLKKKFRVACDTWKSRIAESKETFWKSVQEEKKHVDEELGNDRPLLEDTLTREVVRRILEVYPCVSLF